MFGTPWCSYSVTLIRITFSPQDVFLVPLPWRVTQSEQLVWWHLLKCHHQQRHGVPSICLLVLFFGEIRATLHLCRNFLFGEHLLLRGNDITCCWRLVFNKVRCSYNAVNFLLNPQSRYPIARPWGRGMGCRCECKGLRIVFCRRGSAVCNIVIIRPRYTNGIPLY